MLALKIVAVVLSSIAVALSVTRLIVSFVREVILGRWD